MALGAPRRFGRTDLIVSSVGLGCARIGGIFQRHPAEFVDLLSAALDSGITFFDTADIYSQGESEVLLGRAFRRKRDRVVIASKAGYVLPAQRRLIAGIKPLVRPLIRALGLRRAQLPGVVQGAPAQDFSPGHLRHAVEGSLRRLGTDRLDLFQLHSPPADAVAAGEWVEALEKLKQQGKIRFYGVSCDTVEAAQAAMQHPGVTSVQVVVNLFEREAIREVLPRAHAAGVAVIARECLANGLLAKKGDLDVRAFCRSEDEALRKSGELQTYRQIAAARPCSLPQLALEFVSRLEGVSLSLVGVSRRDQLDELVGADRV